MKTIIVSDAHIKFNETQEDAERRSRFLSFLNSLKGNTDLLVLNGDIFDLWIAWKHVIIKEYFPLLTILADLSANGTRIILTPGNHDFWFSGYLKSQIGIEVCRDSFIETIDGSRFFVNHGDRYTKNDLRYQIFRSIIRNDLVKSIFTLLHPDFALEFGIKLSRSSRNRRIPARRRELMVKSLQKAAFKLLKTHDYDYVIFSHSHIPVICASANGTYANTGDWVSHSSYLLFSDGKLALKEYK
ncbi:MAG: UDP-2,3-diacylglucosamine diphosphatase [Candidatus Cloacimonetes bacterium]|nr:UDP-2,3-diacylglucosamine diphosphatase [Candidatus Cloacimonadota bacterium]